MRFRADELFALPPEARVQERCAEGAMAEGVLAALSWRKVRQGHLTAERRAAVEAHVRAAIEAGEPIRLIDGVGGFKGYRTRAAPGVGWAEVFHLAFVRRWLLPIAERYEPGVELDYAGQGEVATRVDNIRKEAVATYTREFEGLLDHLRRELPDNLRVRSRPLGDFYDLDELEGRFDEWERAAIPSEQAVAIDARLDRAANNYCFHGERDLSGLDEAGRREVLRRSVFALEQFYEHDREERRRYFASGVLLTHGPGFEGAYEVRAIEGSDKTFWMAEGVLSSSEPGARQGLLMPDDPSLERVEWIACDGSLCKVGPALSRVPLASTSSDDPKTSPST